MAEQYPFQGIDTHFTDSLHYQDANEVATQIMAASESGNEADEEPEPESSSDEEWELDLSMLDQNDLSYLWEHNSDKEEWYLDTLNGFASDEETNDWYFN